MDSVKEHLNFKRCSFVLEMIHADNKAVRYTSLEAVIDSATKFFSKIRKK